MVATPILLAIVAAAGPSGPCPIVEEQWLQASDATSADAYGAALALDGATAAVGAPGAGDETGRAYVLELVGGAWQEQQVIVPVDGAAGDRFGCTVGLRDDVLVVGAPFSGGTGSARVYRRDGGTGAWNDEGLLVAPGVDADDRFGETAAVAGDRAVVGAPRDEGGGTVHVFAHDGAAWAHETALSFPAGGANARFGDALAAGAGWILVGAPFSDGIAPGSGAAFLFELVGGAWVLTETFTGSGTAVGSLFGATVARSGDLVVIGSPQDSGDALAGGAAFLFQIGPTGWFEAARLTDSVPEAFGFFGRLVGAGPDRAFVNRRLHEDDGAAFAAVLELIAATAPPGTFEAVALDGDTLLLGVTGPSTGGTVRAYCLDVAACHDCNGNGIADGCDLSEETSTDCNGNFLPDECDLVAGTAPDCNANGIIDDCDVLFATSPDCNGNAVPDECDVALGTSPDCNGNGEPDSCEPAGLVAELIAGDAITGDGTGYTVAIAGDVIAAGAPPFNTVSEFPGSVEIFRHGPGGWAWETRLMASDLEPASRLGDAVDTDGVRVIAGAPRDDWFCPESSFCRVGSAWIFRYDDGAGAWIEEARLVPPSPDSNAEFGHGVAIDGEVAVVGSPGESEAGRVVVYRLVDGAWTVDQIIDGSLAEGTRRFGSAVDVDGGRLVVGDPQHRVGFSTSTGAIRTFAYDGTSWIPGALIVDPDPASAHDFGQEVAISGRTIAVDDPGAERGYALRLVGEAWTVEPVVEWDVSLRSSVAASGGTLVFSNRAPDGTVIKVLSFNGASWVELASIEATNDQGTFVSDFGASLSASDGRIVLGRPLSDIAASFGGALSVYEPEPDDCNGNGVLDACDIEGGVAVDADGNGVPDTCETAFTDLNGDGVTDIDDLVFVVLAFGPCAAPPAPCDEDLDGDGAVDIDDIVLVVLGFD